METALRPRIQRRARGGLLVPLFAAASSHYESSDPHAPRLVLLDEAFAGIDDEGARELYGLDP